MSWTSESDPKHIYAREYKLYCFIASTPNLVLRYLLRISANMGHPTSENGKGDLLIPTECADIFI